MKSIAFAAGPLVLLLSVTLAAAQEPAFRSHPPTRPLPTASQRPLGDGPARYVHPRSGDDQHEGSLERPWRTIQHAVDQLRPGDTLYLRGGTYYEHPVVTCQGTAAAPIVVRGYPGELAVIDGGLREFFESPATAWEPDDSGVAGEYRSTRAWPGLGDRPDATNVMGLLGDSLVPLHGYRFVTDLRSDNEYFAQLDAGKTQQGAGVYCGPGIWYDTQTQRIHARLAPTRQKSLGTDNYQGESDPRRIPLVIAGRAAGPALTLDGARFVRLQDLVVRGACTATLAMHACANVTLEGVTAYGGSSAIEVRDTAGLRLVDCACRGLAAPWTYRGSLKYRSVEARLFSASGWSPTGRDNRDFELAYSEFTDCVDGVFLGNVRNVRFHHNLVDNISDDGIFVTAGTAYDGTTPGGNLHVYQNLLSRCLTTFAFGVGHGRQKALPHGRQTGAGVFIYRNVFDFRRPVMYHQPAATDEALTSYGRVAADHGGPLWEPLTVYHNTIILREPPFRGYYAAGLGGHLAEGSRRLVFNNLVVQQTGPLSAVFTPLLPSPRQAAPPADPRFDFRADGNLHWSYEQPSSAEEFLKRFRSSLELAASQRLYSPGWAARDVVADPALRACSGNWRAAADYRLSAGSPAVDAGVALPAEWHDPLREHDPRAPDIGAVPVTLNEPWSVGVAGRLDVFGGEREPQSAAARKFPDFPLAEDRVPPTPAGRPALIVQGYPAFDAPLVEFTLRRHGVPVKSVERTWVAAKNYDSYGLVAVIGNLPRAGIEPNTYSTDDLDYLRRFLEGEGTLLLMRGNLALFRSDHGRAFLEQMTGGGSAQPAPYTLQLPAHPWVRHLVGHDVSTWISPKSAEPLRATQGETIIGTSSGLATLYRRAVGRGQFIYVGWDIAASLPSGRQPSTVEQEAAFEQQMEILKSVARLSPIGAGARD